MMKLPPIAPGESRVATLELASRVEGTHQWLALVESSGSEPFESLFSTEVVRATLAVEVRHESTIRVDAVGTVGLAIQNRSPVVARDVIVDEKAVAAIIPVLPSGPKGGVASTAPVTVPSSTSGIEATLRQRFHSHITHLTRASGQHS